MRKVYEVKTDIHFEKQKKIRKYNTRVMYAHNPRSDRPKVSPLHPIVKWKRDA